MEPFISPFVLYLAIAIGAVGVFFALPRRTKGLQAIGGVVAASAGGLAILGMTAANLADRPNLYFYIFSLVALGGGLRVITHQRPVYAALYFILTIIATAGLFLILSAEFMAFALIIVYAGAILITYLFVIMLATQTPINDQAESLAGYDLQAREPLAATAVGFVLLAALTTMMFRGIGQVEPASQAATRDSILEVMPGRIETALRRGGLLQPGERIAADPATGHPQIDSQNRTVTLASGLDARRTIPWPQSLTSRNVEGVGMTLIGRHPGTIEIAGVILLMAMLGAVVLSRKQVQLDDAEKSRQARTLARSIGQSAPRPAEPGSIA